MTSRELHELCKPPKLCRDCLERHRERAKPGDLRNFSLHELHNTRLVSESIMKLKRESLVVKHCLDLHAYEGIPYESAVSLALDHLVRENTNLRDMLILKERSRVEPIIITSPHKGKNDGAS